MTGDAAVSDPRRHPGPFIVHLLEGATGRGGDRGGKRHITTVVRPRRDLPAAFVNGAAWKTLQ